VSDTWAAPSKIYNLGEKLVSKGLSKGFDLNRRRWLPYILLAPSLLYLAIFFAYPMVQSLQLAFTTSQQALNLRTEADINAPATGIVALQSEARVLDRVELEEPLPSGQTRPIFWFFVEATDVNGEIIQGWASQRNIFIENRRESETLRIDSGEAVTIFSLDHVQRILSTPRFGTALVTTFLLIILILPLQFILAIIMALILQSQIRGSSLFLYIYAIPLGVADLAAGLLGYAFFTQRGFINSALVSTGLIEQPYIFIQAGNFGWMIFAIVLAEVWRATAIVMVIVVSGLQAIPRDYLEAGEVFGASVWQRVRHIILPLLKPSLQVALILRTILAFQTFAVVVAITGGDVVTVLANETYRWYDPARFNNPNAAAVYALIIMILSLGISLFYLRAVRSQEEAVKAI
jgi:multiple sugar transport system permease protein